MNQNATPNGKKSSTLKSNRFQSRNIKLLEEKEKRNKRILFGGSGLILLSLIILWIFSQSKSPYQLWKGMGNQGSETAFVSSLKGSMGGPGNKGNVGDKGESGDASFEVWKKSNPNNANKSQSDYISEIRGEIGLAGDNDYEVWKRSNLQNSRKSENEYRRSLKGTQGEIGISSFEVWKNSGFENANKTEEDYITFLKGGLGDSGETPYETWKNENVNNPDNTMLGFYNYIKGETGESGLSDYEIWLKMSPDNEGKTKEEYRTTLKGDRGEKGGYFGFIPGEIRTFATMLNDPEWLLCDGQRYSMSQYPDLFRAIKTEQLPDYRGTTIAMAGGANRPGSITGGLTSNVDAQHLPSVEIELDYTHKHFVDIVTTTNGAHTHRTASRAHGTTGSGPAYYTYGPSKGPISAFSEPEGLHAHDVNVTILDTPANLTSSFSLNTTGNKKLIDNRQKTTYAAFYIYAGKKN